MGSVGGEVVLGESDGRQGRHLAHIRAPVGGSDRRVKKISEAV